MTLPGLRLPASASLSLASCWPRPQQLLPVSTAGGGRRRCSQRRLSGGADPIKCITLLLVGHTAQRKEGLFVQTFYKICLILMIVGGINWGLVGLFQFDFVGWLLGGSASIWSRIVHAGGRGRYLRYPGPVYRRDRGVETKEKGSHAGRKYGTRAFLIPIKNPARTSAAIKPTLADRWVLCLRFRASSSSLHGRPMTGRSAIHRRTPSSR